MPVLSRPKMYLIMGKIPEYPLISEKIELLTNITGIINRIFLYFYIWLIKLKNRLTQIRLLTLIKSNEIFSRVFEILD